MTESASKRHYFSGEKHRPSRPLDYIYDPLFTFSGPKDYYRAAHESFQSSSEFSVQPIFESMFSDMVRYPRASVVLRPSHQLPTNIDTSYKGRVKAISRERTITAEVTGSDRYKYFRRPVTENKETSPNGTTSRFPLLGFENVTSLGLLAPPTTAQKPPTRYAMTQVRGTQTDYRESEAQTKPWTPPYTTHGDSTPEVLHLDRLSWGDGLPPGKHEVEVVDRLRRKRAWESQLPPPDCPENIHVRFKIIAEMEKSDWNFREKEIEAIHKERMKKSEKLLEEHNLMNRSRLTNRMEFLEDDVNRRKEHKLRMYRHDKERALRKLCMREKGYDPKKHKMNVVDEHLRKASELYAPMRRHGISFRNRNETLAHKQFTFDDMDICDFAFSPSFRPVFDYNEASKPKKVTELCVRETRWTVDKLVKLHHDLQDLRAKSSKRDTYLTQMEQRPKPSVRLEAEVLPCAQPMVEESLFQAALMIQRIIHSRAMQTLMQQKRDCWKELMQELKITRNGNTVLGISDSRNEHILQARVDGVLDNLIGLNVGSSIGQTLHLLATELLRFKNEDIAHSQALQAEAARWRRELPEEGRRQREIRRREEHNIMFAQLLEVYQDSINEFLETLVAQARENQAKAKAYEHGQEVARMLEWERLNQPKPPPEEPVSADLLFQLIAPDGLRELARTCLLILKQKYHEAHKCLVERGLAARSERSEDSSRKMTIANEEEEKIIERDIPDGKSRSEQTLKSGTEETAESSISSEQLLEMREFVSNPKISDESRSQEPQLLVLMEGKDPMEVIGSMSSTSVVTGKCSASLSEVYDIVSKKMSVIRMEGECRKFEMRGAPEPISAEDRLLARVMRDMCYVAGSLMHTAAKILNKAIQMVGIPQESFDEALQRTMLVINSALEEVIGLILPRKPDEKPPISEELILEASNIVDEILQEARKRIAEMKEEERLKMFSTGIQAEAETIVEEIVKEAQQKVLRIIVEDFLSDLLDEAKRKAGVSHED